jgi:hypothetical protein
MSSTPSALAVCLTLAAFACTEPQCPTGYTKYGNQCRRCKPGEERERGQCVPTPDSNVEPVESDDSNQEGFEDAAAEPDPNEQSDPIEESVDVATEPEAGTDCYRDLDLDEDGVEAGDAVECDQSASGKLTPDNTDCDDSDPARPPRLSDTCGDGIDNDCDGIADDEPNNACGGPCSAKLGHQPGRPAITD